MDRKTEKYWETRSTDFLGFSYGFRPGRGAHDARFSGQGWIVRALGSDSSISRFIRIQLSFAISLRRVRTRYQRLAISAQNATSARVLFETAW